ncbi:AcrR family transcriptional regulator [Rhodococcus sp. 27YEA15]|uniref:TetR/AcrR family transcriptional regulator n=1 Tax=Rhodococcus sp. 27YEA15 TaxID=3156259 RepID=UPI003C7A4A40
MSIEERRAARRAALFDVGVTLLGAVDGPAVNVRAVCKAAGLTERYFYESFTDRDQYVIAVHSFVAEQAQSAIASAVERESTPVAVAEAAVDAFVKLMVDDPAMGRVLLIAPLSEPVLGGRGIGSMPAFVQLIYGQLTEIVDPVDKQLVAVGLVGALFTLFIGYLDGSVDVDRSRFVDHCVKLLTRANHP